MKIANSFNASTKHIKLDKANQQVVIAISVTAALVVFALISVNAIIGQIKYQQLVLDKRNAANDQLGSNYEAAQQLFTMYQAFENNPESMIGTADKNSKVVLDALPSKYDFPAFAVYMQGLVDVSNVSSSGFSGQDQEATAEQESSNPVPILLPANFEVQSDIAGARLFIDNLYRSIKPIKIESITIKGSDSAMTVNVRANSYYQPQKNYTIESTIVKPETSKKTSDTTQESDATDDATLPEEAQ